MYAMTVWSAADCQALPASTISSIPSIVSTADHAGGVCKSATASPLLPAAAKLGAALAQLSIMLHKQEPDAVDTRNSLAAAVSTACLLVDPRIHTGQESAPAAEVNTSLGHPSYNSTPAFRLLLELAVPALAALLLNQGNGQDQHQQQGHHAVQQLWSALGYAPNQLPAATTALRECGPSVELCAASAESLPVMYNLKKLIRALGCSWGQLTQDDLASVASTSSTSFLQQLCQESQQVLLLMSFVKYMFLHGPLGEYLWSCSSVLQGMSKCAEQSSLRCLAAECTRHATT